MQPKEKEATRRVHRLVDQNRRKITSFLQEYVRISSVDPAAALPNEPGDVKACQEWLRNQLAEFGCFGKIDYWEEARDQPNLVVTTEGCLKGKSLMFNGHSDVAPVTPEQLCKWKSKLPWDADIRNGMLWGRGASDMKGGNTAFIWASKLLEEAGVKLRGSVTLSIVIGEESANHQIGCDSVFDRGYSAPLVVSAEPTKLRICPAAMGLFFIKLKVPGKSTHSCFRGQAVHPLPYGEEISGVNAIDKAVIFLEAFSNLEMNWGLYQKHPLVQPGRMALNPSFIRGGEYFAGFPDSCEIVYGVVINPGLTTKQVSSEIKKVVERTSESDNWLRKNRPTLEIPYMQPSIEPFVLPLEDVACRVAAESFRDATGKEAEFSCFPAVCDANFMAEKGKKVIICGPGSLDMGCHGANEHVPIAQVLDACKIYASLMINWCRVSEISKVHTEGSV